VSESVLTASRSHADPAIQRLLDQRSAAGLGPHVTDAGALDQVAALLDESTQHIPTNATNAGLDNRRPSKAWSCSSDAAS